MASRATGVMSFVSDDELDRHYPESSPDPLAGSVTENRAKVKRKTTRSTKQPLVSSSPSKQNRRQSLSEAGFVSPSKSMVLSTPRGGGASPWRIKVTVQTEPGSDDENESPTMKRVTRTQTTTIPLKDSEAQSPVKRRGRPRKSEVASAQKKRSGTPARSKAKATPRDSSVGLDMNIADVDTDAAPKKRRGRPRKSIQRPTENEETLVVDAPQPSGDLTDDVASPEAQEFAQGARSEHNTVTPVPPPQMVLPAIETTMATPQEPQARSDRRTSRDNSHLLPPSKMNTTREAPEDYERPIRFTPPQTELSQRLRARKGTPASKGKISLEISSDEDSDGEDQVPTPSESEEEASVAREQPGNPSLEAAIEPEEPYQPSEVTDDDDEDALEDVTSFAFEEGATRLPNDTTIIDSENFTMISVDSLPSSGGLTSPVYGPSGRTPTAPQMAKIPEKGHLSLPLDGWRQPKSSPQLPCASSPRQLRAVPAVSQISLSPRAVPPRHKTPVIDEAPLAHPPPIEPARLPPSQVETPKIGRVVTAGVALQGVLDPNRVTPGAGPSNALDRQQAEFDELFRGFSERTRKELRAGLELGQQLARDDSPNRKSSPALSSPIKAGSSACPDGNICATQSKQRESRLLTPEDQDDYKMPSPPVTQPTDVQYPLLNINDQDSHLPSPSGSPARDENEMSWRVDTPPIHAAIAKGRRSKTVTDKHNERAREQGGSVVADPNRKIDEDFSDIWQEEGSQSSNTPDVNDAPAAPSPPIQDLFAQEGALKPARGKLPRTWRRKSSGHFHYSDEAEESSRPTPSSTESDEAPQYAADKGKRKTTEPVVAEELSDDSDDMSDMSEDDTGMFFVSNLPNVFQKTRSPRRRTRKTEKLDLSLLLNEGDSLLPESSPPVAASKTPTTSKANPFLDTPPQFTALQSSPAKSSPLRHEIRGSDISSESVQQGFEESTLPLPPSSPFHTQVEEDAYYISTASDQRQFRHEMVGSTDSSLRHIRNEADGYLDAYEAQERSLNGITEITEPDRSWNNKIAAVPSSPPAIKHTFEESMIKGTRTYAPLFGGATITVEKASSARAMALKPAKKVIAVAPRTEEPVQTNTSIFGRLTSTLWGAIGSAPLPSLHPVVAKLDPLPKVEPWTKTHYKTLDALYQLHKKELTLFSSSASSSNCGANAALLDHFLRTSNRPFLGAKFSAWGYSVVLDESLVVMCAAYVQLLTLHDASEYEEKTGKKIQMGDCAPGPTGEVIAAEEVVRRLATVIMGEKLRKDEKKGKKIVREGSLSVKWPE